MISLQPVPGSLHFPSLISLSILSIPPFHTSWSPQLARPLFSAIPTLQQKVIDRKPHAPLQICTPILMCASLWLQISVPGLLLFIPQHRPSYSRGLSLWSWRQNDFCYSPTLNLILCALHPVPLLHRNGGQSLKRYSSISVHPFNLSVWCFTFRNFHILGHCTLIATLSIWRRSFSFEWFISNSSSCKVPIILSKYPCYIIHLAKPLSQTFFAAPWTEPSNIMGQLVKLDYTSS